MLSPTLDATAYCQPLRAQIPNFAVQRLSVEDMQGPAVPTGVKYVEGYGFGSALNRLAIEDAKICISGEVPEGPDADASLGYVSFQFGLVDPPTPHPVSSSAVLNVTLESDRSMFMYATLTGRPGSEYGTFIFNPLPEPQTLTFSTEDFFPRQEGALPWDPSLLDSVGFRLAAGAGPFRLCISRLAFE
jgi:hypothetical protein